MNKENNEERFRYRHWEGKTILIAEDIYTNFLYLEAALSKTNVTILYAINGLEAVDLCKENPGIDLVLMDLSMPIMNGYEATVEIKKIRKNLPVIAQTAYSLDFDKDTAINVGCNDYLVKPILPKLLFDTISEYIEKDLLN
ncbi:MAG TPA: response regulator [Bacteroidales bacterium]|nr:response regulator [Bacteroidales bacterium]HPT03675.1 response regulator [Bacteroidales bacterium]